MLSGLSEFIFTIRLLDAGKCISEIELGKGSTRDKETGGIGGSPIGEAMLDTVALKLMTVS